MTFFQAFDEPHPIAISWQHRVKRTGREDSAEESHSDIHYKESKGNDRERCRGVDKDAEGRRP